MRLLGVDLLGVNTSTLHKLALTVAAIAIVLALRYAIVGMVRLVTREAGNERVVFWTRQGASLGTAIALAVAGVSIWFSSSERFGTFAGLIGAGIAFAMQKVITAFAGYLVILRGKTFTVGDRITMGGVRGDVIALGFLQTRIMEMGEPQDAQSGDNPSWVHARQFTGRIVTVTNDKVFDEPIYNFTREFPFIWEEMRIPVKYGSDHRKVEQILLDCACAVTAPIQDVGDDVRQVMERKYFIDINTLKPRVFYVLTDNWIALHLRFITQPHGVRNLKDEISRRMLERFEQEGIEIASSTYDVVGLPPLRIEGSAVARIADALERQRTPERRSTDSNADAERQARRSA